MDRRTDTEGYNIIPRHTLVAGYKNTMNLDQTAPKMQSDLGSYCLHIRLSNT